MRNPIAPRGPGQRRRTGSGLNLDAEFDLLALEDYWTRVRQMRHAKLVEAGLAD